MRVETYPDLPRVANFYLDSGERFASLISSQYYDRIHLYFHEGAWTFSHHVRLNGECRYCGKWHRWLIEEAVAAGWECPAPDATVQSWSET